MASWEKRTPYRGCATRVNPFPQSIPLDVKTSYQSLLLVDIRPLQPSKSLCLLSVHNMPLWWRERVCLHCFHSSLIYYWGNNRLLHIRDECIRRKINVHISSSQMFTFQALHFVWQPELYIAALSFLKSRDMLSGSRMNCPIHFLTLLFII